MHRYSLSRWATLAAAGLLLPAAVFAGPVSFFQAGNLVVSVEGNGSGTGTYTDNQAAPLTLFQYAPTGTSSATFVSSLELPQTASGVNLPISGEYGSSSEGTLQLSGNGQYLTIMGYGVNADAFNTGMINPTTMMPGGPGYGYSANNDPRLAQSSSLTGQSYTAVPRVVATIDANGNVNSTTALYNIFDTNNPRSVYSTDGSTFYVSGQGTGTDATGGVFYANLGSSSATQITGIDAMDSNLNFTIGQDTRDVQIYNGQLYVSADTKEGKNSARDYIGSVGTGTPTTTVPNNVGPAFTAGPNGTGIGLTSTGKLTVSAATANGINATSGGNGISKVNLSPESYFFAAPNVLYVADSGAPKNDSNASSGGVDLGDGGLQKWVNSASDGSGIWSLEYTISAGLSLVANTSTYTPGTNQTTGLFGLTGEVLGNQVYLFATSYTLGDLDNTYLYGITDLLSATTKAGESFSTLAQAPADSNFKGVSFAPQYQGPVAPEPGTFVLFGLSVTAVLTVRARRSRRPLKPQVVGRTAPSARDRPVPQHQEITQS